MRGGKSLAGQRAFAGLIPEAARRQLHQRPGYGSVLMLGRRMGGLNEAVVKEVLRLDLKLADRPRLRALLETGRAGWSKLRAVAAIATVDDEAEWARHVETLPKDTLEALVRARRQGLGLKPRRDQPISGAPRGSSAPQGPHAATDQKPRHGPGEAGPDEARPDASRQDHHAARDDADGARQASGTNTRSGPEPSAESTPGSEASADGLNARNQDDKARAPAGSASLDEGADGDECDTPNSAESSAPGGAPTAGAHLLPDEHLVAIRLRPRTAERLQKMARHLRKNLSPTMSMSDVVDALIQGFSNGKLRPLQYCEVIVRGVAGGPAHCRTRYGDVRVTQEDLARGQAVRPPVDLELLRRECKAEVASGAQSAPTEPAHTTSAGAPGVAQSQATDDASAAHAQGHTATVAARARGLHRGKAPPPRGSAAPQTPSQTLPHGATKAGAPEAGSAPRVVAQRHIPAHVKHYLELHYGGFCAFPGCHKPATVLHHVNRFALNPSHDPDGIAPLCKAHEGLAHAGLIANELDPPDRWRVRDRRAVRNAAEAAVARVDAAVNERRKTKNQGDAPSTVTAHTDEH